MPASCFYYFEEYCYSFSPLIQLGWVFVFNKCVSSLNAPTADSSVALDCGECACDSCLPIVNRAAPPRRMSFFQKCRTDLGWFVSAAKSMPRAFFEICLMNGGVNSAATASRNFASLLLCRDFLFWDTDSDWGIWRKTDVKPRTKLRRRSGRAH